MSSNLCQVITTIFATLVGLVLLTHIAIVFYVEGFKVREIRDKRENVLGFWAVIGMTYLHYPIDRLIIKVVQWQQ